MPQELAAAWDGKRKRCLTPEDLCKAKGGAWDGKSCQPPGASTVPQANPAEDCRNKGGYVGRQALPAAGSNIPAVQDPAVSPC